MEWGDIARFLVCPYCSGPLTQTGRAVSCPCGHAFDIARDGYLNLLPATRHSSSAPGDSRAMLAARRSFLAGGHYQRLSDRVNALAIAHLATVARALPAAPLPVLDLGCGEGYYLGRLDAAAGHAFAPGRVRCLGLDVAKDAARLAARHHRACRFAVADIRSRLPVADATMALALNIFAPRHAVEFRRVMHVDGLLIVVIPVEDHLAELRATLSLLGIEAQKRERVLARLAGLFSCVEEMTLTYEITLSSDERGDLIAMMPSVRHLTDAARGEIRRQTGSQTRVGFHILAFRPLPVP